MGRIKFVDQVVQKLFFEKVSVYRWQIKAFGLTLLTIGTAFGAYITTNNLIIPSLFAASAWTQDDWSGSPDPTGVYTATTTNYGASTDIDTDTTMTLSGTSGWANDYSDWSYRKAITFNNTDAHLGVTSENLSNFPVLIKLDSGSDIDYSKTKDQGEDIRFTDSDGTLLSYEIEDWDESGTSYVWVKVPQIDQNSSSDYIYLYYGNASAIDGQNPSDVWDNGYQAVWHNDDLTTSTIEDSAGDNDMTKRTAGEPYEDNGQIGSGQKYDGNNDYSRTDNSFVEGATSLTISSWIKHDDDGHTYECALHKGSGNTIGSTDYWLGVDINDQLTATIGANQGGIGWNAGQTSTVAVDGTWYHLVATWDGSAVRVYINGEFNKQYNLTSYGDLTTPTRMGSSADGTNYQFNGVIDETRIATSSRSAAWVSAVYHSDTDDFASYGSEESNISASGDFESVIFDGGSGGSFWEAIEFSTTESANVTVKARTQAEGDTDFTDAPDWSSCTALEDQDDMALTDTTCIIDGHRYIQYYIAMTPNGTTSPSLSDITLNYSPYDTTEPSDPSSIKMYSNSDKDREISGVDQPNWNNATGPYFEWTGSTDTGGSDLKGYCLYLGTSAAGEPQTSKGILGTSPVTVGTKCQFIVASKNVDFTTSGYLSSALQADTTYYLRIRAIDNADNISVGTTAFSFKHDSTPPTNVGYISAPSSTFSNVVDMFFSWPVSGGSQSSDVDSGVLGYQYQIGGTGGSWLGTETDSTCELDYIPQGDSIYNLTALQDDANIEVGNNVIYFRTIDIACNPSSVATYRTANLAYGGDAPSFLTSCGSSSGVTVTPTTSDTNSFSLSWEDANPASGQSIDNYYYMVNTTPPSSLSTITSNTTTYIDNGTETSVAEGALVGAIKGSNTLYVVAVDDADNYSASNCLKGEFTLDSELPDPPTNISATDASIKSTSLWRASLGWGEPSYKGTGNLTYIIERSTDNTNWISVATTTGTSYIDTVTESALYYWRVGVYDTSAQSQASPSYATAVSLTPKGTYTDPPNLTSGPEVSSITTKKATISWTTDRTSDSKIQYGTSSGSYFDEEPSNSAQVTSHSISLTNLDPGTTYYYRAKWTDEDGNTGESDEKTFTTDPAPSIQSVKVRNIGLSTATIEFTSIGSSEVKIYYGQTTSFGGVTSVSTATSESTYTVNLEGLDDGTTYYYKLNAIDSEDSEYEGTVLDFETLPRPRIENVRVQQVKGTAQPTVLVSWETNTEVSSIVTYYPVGNPASARDEVNVTLKEGEHQMIVRGLLPKTNYTLIVKGRDRIGNEAQSDAQTVTTATDTRPPRISNLTVEGAIQRSGDEGTSTAQLIVSWDTDEPATSQVEYGEGTGVTYAQRSQEDSSLTFNHVVIISGLTPSKVYHFRAISKDAQGNEGLSVDTVTITPKSSKSALDLVITNLGEAFGFLRR